MNYRALWDEAQGEGLLVNNSVGGIIKDPPWNTQVAQNKHLGSSAETSYDEDRTLKPVATGVKSQTRYKSCHRVAGHGDLKK